MRLIKNLLNGGKLDNSPRPLMKRRAFLLGVAGVAERNEDAALSAPFAFALHDGFEGVKVRPPT